MLIDIGATDPNTKSKLHNCRSRIDGSKSVSSQSIGCGEKYAGMVAAKTKKFQLNVTLVSDPQKEKIHCLNSVIKHHPAMVTTY
jgi:hypothetical protein